MTDAQGLARPGAAASASDGPWPTVTAVIPTKDRPVLLARAVDAVMKQDYTGPIECIVFLDGTKPATHDVEVKPR